MPKKLTVTCDLLHGRRKVVNSEELYRLEDHRPELGLGQRWVTDWVGRVKAIFLCFKSHRKHLMQQFLAV